MTLDETGRATMEFSSEPTAQADDIAYYARGWYEAHRESWWERHRPGSWHRRRETADNFMLSLVNEIVRIHNQAQHRDGGKHG